MDLGLKDRVAVVAAASQGLGKAVALGLAREGARVAICARGAEALQAAAREIHQAAGSDVLACLADVTIAGEVAAFVRATLERFGRIDICVANAGGPPAKSFADTTIEDWEDAVRLNLMSTLHLAREVLPHMKSRRWGRFITITSVSVKQPIDGLVLSNSVRAAVAGLAKTLAREYGPYNILVNNVCPGYTATQRLNDLAEELAEAAGITPEQARARWVAAVPLERLARPEEFADVVVFLASERASYVTGSSIAIDGGLIQGL